MHSYFQSREFYKNILDSIQIGVIITDPEGRLVYINDKYGDLLNIDPLEPIGKHVTEVIATSRLHIVAKTGKPEINWPHELKGQTYLVQRIPIKEKGKIVAVLGTVLFNDPGEVSKLSTQLNRLESKLKLYERKLTSLLSTQYSLDNIIGESQAMADLKNEALKAMANDFPVLITGESGTGKELFAQAIHHGSARRFSPFVQFNCAAIPESLFESELFGYERGAFTGANPKGKVGKFELADQGTIFLDEIGELPQEMQPKLLRVLETKQVERVGGTEPVASNFRVIAATNKNLEEMLREGRFRPDLFYRINVIPIAIPPLRQRPEDIPSLTYHLLDRLTHMTSFKKITIHEEAMQCLQQYEWPGNVRELSNVLERVLCSLQTDTIRFSDLPQSICKPASITHCNSGALKLYTDMAEKRAIREALQAEGNNKSRAAERLGIHRSLLYKKMKRYGMM